MLSVLFSVMVSSDCRFYLPVVGLLCIIALFMKCVSGHSQIIYFLYMLWQEFNISIYPCFAGSFATATCMMCKYKVDAEAIRKDIFDQVPLIFIAHRLLTPLAIHSIHLYI